LQNELRDLCVQIGHNQLLYILEFNYQLRIISCLNMQLFIIKKSLFVNDFGGNNCFQPNDSWAKGHQLQMRVNHVSTAPNLKHGLYIMSTTWHKVITYYFVMIQQTGNKSNGAGWLIKPLYGSLVGKWRRAVKSKTNSNKECL